jgi:hypothetical protein
LSLFIAGALRLLALPPLVLQIVQPASKLRGHRVLMTVYH